MNTKEPSSGKKNSERGQGLTEYALILTIAGIIVIGIISLLRPQISDVFSRFVRQAPVAPPALLAYTPPPTLTPTPPPDPTVCRTLSISVSPAGGGTWEQSPPPNCDTDKYNNNTVVTLTALPASGYQFGSWSGGASGNNAVVMLTMNENKSVTATFSRFCYELAMVVAPTNAGTINPSPAANCGVNKYTEGTVVTVTTLPGVGYQFNNWSDDASGTNLSATVTMDSNKRVTANYSLRCYTLTTAAVPAAGGTINPDPGPDCVGNSYTHGSQVLLSNSPASGYLFANWSGDVGGTTATVLVTMNENKNVTANFSQTCYTLTTAVSPANSGTITPSSPPNCGSTQYTAGTVVTLSAAPAGSGYQFSNWSGDASGTIPTAPITMNGNRSVTANFSQVCYTVTTAVAPNNSGTVNRTPPPNCGVDRYMAGTTITFAAIPSTGYQFNNWSGSATGSASPVSLMVDGDKAVTANFSQACFTLTTAVSPNGGGTVNRTPAPNCNSTQYNAGTVVTLSPAPANGYNFANWSGDVTGATTPATVTMNGDRSVTANFSQSCLTPVMAISSSNENGSLGPANAIDGDPNTRWSSWQRNASDPINDNQWIYVDLGSRYNVNRVVLHWERAYGRDYDVQVSDDSNDWTTIRSITNGSGGTVDLTGLNGDGRYVRMRGIRRGTQWGYSLWEFEVCGTPNAQP